MKLATKYIVDYFNKFKHRQDKTILSTVSENDEIVNFSEEAFLDLEIDKIYEKVVGEIPLFVGCGSEEEEENKQKEYLMSTFKHPLFNEEKIIIRQELINEIADNRDLEDIIRCIKESAALYLYDKSYSRSEYKEVEKLHRIKLVVNLIDNIQRLDNYTNKRLKEIKEFSDGFVSDKSFLEVKNFVKNIHERYSLDEESKNLIDILNNRELRNRGGKREFYRISEYIIEITDRLLNEEQFEGFINKEAKAVNLLKILKNKSKEFYNEVFTFKGDSYDFQRENNEYYQDLFGYWLDLINEALYSRIAEINIGSLPEELGFYLGTAALQREWKSTGVPITKPEILDKREKKVSIVGSHNTSLLLNPKCYEVFPNDIYSDRDTNLFVITGPNNGGKTTYLRQVGQMYWLTHIGMWLPAKSAQVSLVDGIFTSILNRDNTEEGEGLYLSELCKVENFTNLGDNTIRTTPYSVLFFDEFANGTNHEESVERTRVILEYCSSKAMTTYFTAHKKEISDSVEKGEIPGSLNLSLEVIHENGDIRTTRKILRDRSEGSYGHLQAELKGITRKNLARKLNDEIKDKLYPVEDTRLGRIKQQPL